MSIESNDPLIQMTWTDPVTGKYGYFIAHNLVNGLCTGGTRMRAGCTSSEVADLARGMALKAATYGLPVGGAKGGIDCDPKDPEADAVLHRFMMAMRPWLNEHWVTAEDLGVTQPQIDRVFADIGLGQSFHAAIERSDNPQRTLARVQRDMNVLTSDGYQLGEIAGGYGVAQSCMGIVEAENWRPEDTTVAIQGVGTMGGGAAWYLHQAGVKIVAVADVGGCFYEPEGLDIPALLDARNERGEIDRTKVSSHLMEFDRDAVLSFDVDILIPAATSYVITSLTVDQISAKYVVEAANAATTSDAETELASNGTAVIPDFVANSGAVVWAWWMLFGQASDAEATLSGLQAAVRSNVATMIEQWTDNHVYPRVTASWIANENVRSAVETTIVVP